MNRNPNFLAVKNSYMRNRSPQSSHPKRIAALLLCLFVASLYPFAVLAQDSGPIYIVQPGDTLYLIAQRFGTSVEAIASENNITDPSVIVPGSELIIPGYEGVSGTLEFHEVEFGETITSLSFQYGISENALIRLNHILHPRRVYIGQALIVSVSHEEELTKSQQVLLAGSGESKLAFAARNAINPWDFMQLSNPLDRFWVLPNERLSLPGVDDFVRSFPAPILKVEVNPTKGVQGQTLVIKVNKKGAIQIHGFLGEQQLSFHEAAPDQLIALQGILALLEPGMYDLEIEVLDETGERDLFSFSQPIGISSGEYSYDPILYVPAETIDPIKTTAENELIQSVIHEVTEKKYWEGIFLFPTEYTDAFPSYFGSRRNYNSQGYNWYHSGLDLYGGTGTPIKAPASGKVVFAGMLEVRGNVTFIDHGWGIFSGYLHQSAIEVQEGDLVEQGQLIGYVGGTGRVTGPHLHWEIWVGGVPVDPLDWTSQVFP